MNYFDSITDFFKQPNYVKNLLLASVCVLIPIVGIMVVLGWLAIGLWGRKDRNPATFPDFDFGQFGYYLQRGLWPVLTVLAVSLGLGIAGGVVLIVPQVVLNMVLGNKGLLGMVNGLISFLLNAVLFIGILAVVVPVMIRATLLQDFIKAFDFNFTKNFASAIWKELLVSAVFVYVVSSFFGFIGMLALCIGLLPATVLSTYCYQHQMRQLYDLFLQRGGEPIPVSPLLSESGNPPAPETI